MSKEHRTPYADDALRVQRGITPSEIRDFVDRRARAPYRINGITIWNFNNHVLNDEALSRDSKDFQKDEYIIPFQASGVWGYMTTLLPPRLREAEILTYKQDDGRYIPFPNYLRHSDEDEDEELQEELDDVLRDL